MHTVTVVEMGDLGRTGGDIKIIGRLSGTR
jgi:hypothetical protein